MATAVLTDRVDRDTLSSRLRPESAGGGGRRLPRRTARGARRALRACSGARRQARRSMLRLQRLTRRQRSCAGTRSRSTPAGSTTRRPAPGEDRVFGEQLGPGPLRARDGDRPHRDLRRGERDHRRLPELHAAARASEGHLDGGRHRAGGARYAGRDVPVPERRLRRAARGRPGRDSVAEATRRGERSPARAARGRGDPGPARQTTARSTRSRGSASSTSRARRRGSGARIRSARSRWRWEPTGAA